LIFDDERSVGQIPSDHDADRQERINADLAFLKEFDRLVAEASDEVLSMDDFPPIKFSRDLIIFDDEE